MKKTTALLRVLMLAIFIVASITLLSACNRAPDGAPVEIAKQNETQYVVVFNQSGSLSPRWANTLKETFFSEFGIEVKTTADTADEVEYEIIVGDTSRAISVELKAAVTSGKAEDSWLWGFGYKDGKLAIYANSQKAFNKALEMMKNDYFKDGVFAVPDNLWVTYEYTKAEQDAEAKAEADRLAAEAEAEKLAWQEERLIYIKAENARFNNADFGESPALLDTDRYNDPLEALTVGEHPRVMVNADMIPGIKAALENPEYAEIAKSFWELADARDLTGIFKEKTHSTGETYRYDEKTIACIEAKAFAYLLTGRSVYGYEAIYAIKNAMMSYKYITALHMDVYHGPSYLMIIAAEVYDWCYDLLTNDDKTQIINGVYKYLMDGSHFTKEDFVLESNYPKSAEYPNGVKYGMEMKYPPYGMNGVSGHGTGPQFLRDYMTVAVAFADERPDWWDCIGGRYYQEYLPVANYFMQNGWVSQGSTGYGDYKLYCYLWTAWLLETATGENPYVDGASKTAYFMLSQVMPSGKSYETGDGGRNAKGASINFQWMFLHAALYNDTTILANAKYYSTAYKSCDNSAFSTMTRAMQLILVSNCDVAKENRLEGLELISYFSHPAGQMTIRESWRDDCAGTFMKIGEMTMANHDNMDTGTFQIYYKGFLACSSGSYNKYGSPAHKYYLQATVSANGLLIYNPNLANTDGGWYSGGQTLRGEAGTITNWLDSGKYNMGTVTGYAMGYKSDGTAKYGYIAGNITPAYNSTTVDHVGRSMLTVYTENEKFPMVFFVFDNATSDSADYKKTFLLHTVKEPEIDTDNLTATVIEGDGKLVLTNITAGEKIVKIGGAGYAYWVGNENDFDSTEASGKNCTDDYATSDKADTIWGRIEVIAEKEKTTNMLNVMYVTDKETTETLTPKKIEGDGIVGAVVDKICAVFSTEEERTTESFSFTAEVSGTIEYYIGGLHAGKWNVTVEGESAKTYTAKEDSGMITFKAASGKKITVTPGSDILPEGKAIINFKLDGGTLPTGALQYYTVGQVTSLAELVAVRNNDVFVGWYTDAALTNRITEISADTTGSITLYAKYKNSYVYEDFSESVIDVAGKTYEHNNLRYFAQEKAGASFKTVTDGDGKSYLVWIKGSKDPMFIGSNAQNGFNKLTGDKIEVSYEVSFQKNGSNPMSATTFRLQIANDEGGGESPIFKTDREGNVYYASNIASGQESSNLIVAGSDNIVTLRFVVNFTDAIITFYEEDGDILSVRKLIIPARYDSVESFRAVMTTYYFYWYSPGAESDTSIRIYKVSVTEGNLFA